jgi:glycosyltransferase involved in cell wall biosynthesis
MPYKIIAVDDGSKDGLLKILKDNYDSDIIIEAYKVNMNVGAAFSTGLFRAIHEAKSDEDIAIIMEGDQTSSTNVINNLINEIQNKQLDIVIDSRYRNEGGFKNFPLLRRLYSKNASRLMRKFFPSKNDILDYSIFFRAYRMEFCEKLWSISVFSALYSPKVLSLTQNC